MFVAGKRRQDEALARYFAYRFAVFLDQHPDVNRVQLGRMLGLAKPEVTGFVKGRNGSHQKVAQIARVLKPESEEEFKQLAKEWAEQNPTWKPEDPLPARITHTGDPLEAAVGGKSVYSEGLRDATRAIIGLAKCTPDQAREAARLAREATPEGMDGDWLFWLQRLRDYVEHLKKGSGERPSVKLKLP